MYHGVSQSSRWSRSGWAEPTDVQVSPHWCLRPIEDGATASFLLQFFHLFRILGRRTSKAQNILEMIFSKKHRFLKAVKADSRPQTMDGELRGLRGNRKNRDTFQAGELYLHLVPCFFQKAPFFLGIFLIFQPRLTPEGILATTFQQLWMGRCSI